MEDVQVVAMLVRRCIAGDAAAWEEIVQTYNRRIYNICYRFAGSGDDAQDLTQEVFIKMYRTLSSYDPNKGAFVTWVTTITRNLLVDHFRKTKQERMTDSMDTTASEHERETGHCNKRMRRCCCNLLRAIQGVHSGHSNFQVPGLRPLRSA